ncbi:tetratricopeptide repeat protein 1-like [Schistocerca gregaria]|uniref:tetratricopeptide repeat protein 1-like n=1 Tax=Schistocerca gregaria TaxID=7010 RepID=UPI00211F0C91|nr:tetratricopeptide repeat protein 1-like [Schistocerca gregaria]XP_049847789.1 tetratricopeptide repeat protein 1-like [Schistocerca gregaria]
MLSTRTEVYFYSTRIFQCDKSYINLNDDYTSSECYEEIENEEEFCENSSDGSEAAPLAESAQDVENDEQLEELSAEELERRTGLAEEYKQAGNEFYTNKNYENAIQKYTEALEVAPKMSTIRSVILSNRAACHVVLADWDSVIKDTTAAIKIDPNHLKSLARRALAYEEQSKFQEAIDDINKLIQLDADCKPKYAYKLQVLEKKLQEKRQKEQEEMIGQMKDMGNKFLGLFGLSLDNFKAEKNPENGSYKISFQK